MPSLARVVAGTVHSMGTTLRNFFRPANTLQYPRDRRPIPRQWRAGSFALTTDPATGEENCIGCRLCEYICPSQIISVSLRKGAERKNGIGATYCDRFTLDYQACMQCELCVQVCPTDAIVMTRELAAPTYRREDLFLSKEKLIANGLAFHARPDLESHATGTRLREWTDASRGLPPAAGSAEPEGTPK